MPLYRVKTAHLFPLDAVDAVVTQPREGKPTRVTQCHVRRHQRNGKCDILWASCKDVDASDTDDSGWGTFIHPHDPHEQAYVEIDLDNPVTTLKLLLHYSKLHNVDIDQTKFGSLSRLLFADPTLRCALMHDLVALLDQEPTVQEPVKPVHPTYYRTVFTVEVLHTVDLEELSLASIVTDEDPRVSWAYTSETDTVSLEQMAHLLSEQNTSPDFFLPLTGRE